MANAGSVSGAGDAPQAATSRTTRNLGSRFTPTIVAKRQRIDLGLKDWKTPCVGMFAKSGIRWSPGAKERLGRVPFFVRPFVKKRAESVARERGMNEVTPELLTELKSKEHTG